MKIFEILLGIVALLVAGVAAFFSVKGIGILFAGAAIETMVMASALELAKLVTTSYLYRYWKKTTILLKTYLISAVIVLMGITSLGIFGFLSCAYQKSSSEFGVYTTKIETIEGQKKYITDQISETKERIESLNKNRNDAEQRLTDAQTKVGSSLLGSQLIKLQTQTASSIASISKDIEDENLQYQTLEKKSQDFDQQIVDLKSTSQASHDIITFQFIADAVGLPLNTVVKYFIFVIIIVFDPLAVGLVLAYNTAIFKDDVVPTIDLKKKNERSIIEKPKIVSVPPPLPIIKTETDNQSMEEKIEEKLSAVSEPINLDQPKKLSKEEAEYIKRSTLTERLRSGDLEDFPFDEMPNLTIKT